MQRSLPCAALLARTRERTRQQGACLVWLDQHGQPYSKRDHRGGPQLRWQGQQLYARQVWHLHLTGQGVPRGSTLQYACTTPGCICHTRVVTHEEHGQQVAASGALRSMERRRKIAQAKRARAAVMEAWKVELIRFGPLPAAHYAAEFGISKGWAARIRRGQAWQDYQATPFGGLGDRTTVHRQLAANASSYVRRRVAAA